MCDRNSGGFSNNNQETSRKTSKHLQDECSHVNEPRGDWIWARDRVLVLRLRFKHVGICWNVCALEPASGVPCKATAVAHQDLECLASWAHRLAQVGALCDRDLVDGFPNGVEVGLPQAPTRRRIEESQACRWANDGGGRRRRCCGGGGRAGR